MKFTENNIRPKKLIDEGKKYLKQDIVYLLNFKKKFVKVNCPACKSKVKSFMFTKNDFNYVSCDGCKTFYVNPRPTEKILNKFYDSSKLYDYWNNFIFPATEKVRSKKIFLPRALKIIQIVKKFKIKRNFIMDIGAGYGTFCQVIKGKKFFKKVIALEPNKEGSKKCIEKKIYTLNASIEKVKKKDIKDVNVATSFEVIEHLYSPEKFLKKIYDALSRKAMIVVTCPNGLGFDISILGKKSEAIDHEHLNYFNPISIKILMERCGFNVLDVMTPGVLDVDIVYNKFNEKKFTTKNNFYRQILSNKNIRNKFQNFLIKNKLSSNMWIVAQKK
jgi:2-polyprenyl-3-methyl-5-hydroxy-6-metoxy-1,4-benzoquinol methylase/ribosomal protein S27E